MSNTDLLMAQHSIRSALATLRPYANGLNGEESPGDKARNQAIKAIGDAVLTLIDETEKR